MRFVSPVVPGAELEEVELAKGQPEFETLPVVNCGFGVLLCRAELDDAEIEEIQRSRSIYLFQVTGGGKPNPIILDVWRPDVLPDTSRPAIPNAEGVIAAPMVVSVCVIGQPNDSPGEAVAMLRAVESRFPPPYRFGGFSLRATYDRISPVHPSAAAIEHPTLDGVFVAFRELVSGIIESKDLPISPEHFCALIAAGPETFLLDANVFYLARRNAPPAEPTDLTGVGGDDDDGGSVN